MGLYRYFRPDPAVETLRACELVVVPPKYLDDPFEGSPVIKCADPAGYTEQRLIDVTNSPEWFEEHRADFPGLTFEQFQNGIKAHSKELMQKLVASVPDVDQNFQSRVPDLISEKFGIICFTSSDLNPTMWARYASHGGAVIGFDERHQLFSGRSFFKVEYTDTPYTFDASSPHTWNDVELILKRKGLAWADQCELRLVVGLEVVQSRNTSQGPRYLLPIGSELITSVTLGLRLDPKVEREIVQILKHPKFKHVECYKVVKNIDASILERRKF